MWLARRHLVASYPDIGLAFGRDHTTAMHGVAKIEVMRSATVVAVAIAELEAALKVETPAAGPAGELWQAALAERSAAA